MMYKLELTGKDNEPEGFVRLESLPDGGAWLCVQQADGTKASLTLSRGAATSFATLVRAERAGEPL
jgi:hypothetical protein